MSTHIKLITEDTDISKLDIYKNNWDVKIYGRPYQVACIPGYVHTIGGRMGVSDLWAWPLGEEPTYENMIEYNIPFGCVWGYKIEPHNRIEYNWDEKEAYNTIAVTITRNGEPFYGFTCSDELYALSKVHQILSNIKDSPIPFSDRNYEKRIIGRKIYYGDQPAIITEYKDYQVFIEPDGISSFRYPAWVLENDYSKEEWDCVYKQGLWVTVNDGHIYWFRNNDNKGEDNA